MTDGARDGFDKNDLGLPGAVFPIDKQCELIFGQGSRACVCISLLIVLLLLQKPICVFCMKWIEIDSNVCLVTCSWVDKMLCHTELPDIISSRWHNSVRHA